MWQTVSETKKRYRKFRRLLLTAAPAAICLQTLAIRSLSPVIAAGGLRPLVFLLCDLLACALWASGLALLAYGANQI